MTQRRRWKWAGLVAGALLIALALCIIAQGLMFFGSARWQTRWSGTFWFERGGVVYSPFTLGSRMPSFVEFRSSRGVRLLPMASLDYIYIPLWIPTLLLSIPTAWLWLRGRRPLPGSCPRCGYDLRGTPSDTCPECGARP